MPMLLADHHESMSPVMVLHDDPAIRVRFAWFPRAQV
jgi:hypothetical protein